MWHSSVWTTFYLNLVNTTLLHLNIKQFFKIMQTYVNYVIISCKLCLKCDNFLCVTACLDLTNRGTMYISQNSFSNLHDFPSDESTNNFCKIKVNATWNFARIIQVSLGNAGDENKSFFFYSWFYLIVNLIVDCLFSVKLHTRYGLFHTV